MTPELQHAIATLVTKLSEAIEGLGALLALAVFAWLFWRD